MLPSPTQGSLVFKPILSAVLALSVSSTSFAATEADVLKFEGLFAEHMKNIDVVAQHLENISNGDASNDTDFGEPEAWNDLVVALTTLQTVSNNVQASIPGLLAVIFNFPVFTVRHTALCSQLTQVNTAWTSLEFADVTTLPFNQRLGALFYQDARALVSISRGPAGLQCPF
jgi:hypothetical protein